MLTSASQADLYIAHIADGGPASNRWTTQFRFVNSGTLTGQAVIGAIYFYADDGTALPVDFGSGPYADFKISIPPGGSARAETLGNASTLHTGFVRMVFDSPVQVSAEFRNWQNGVVANGASVNGVAPAYSYWYSADPYTGVSIANPNGFAVTCTGSFLDVSGNLVAQNKAIALGTMNHTAFTVGGLLSLASTAVGSFQLKPCKDNSGNLASVVSLGIAGNAGGITSSLPESSGSIPVRHGEDIEKAFTYVVKVIQTDPNLSEFAALVGQPQLIIVADNNTINACAENPQSAAPCNGPVGTIKVWLSLAELLADSPNEIAFAIAHELGHVVQMNLGNQKSLQMIAPTSTNTTVETDADLFALLVTLTGGYDPYAAAGTLGKLMMITGNSTINAQFEENIQAVLGTDMHTSTLNRLANLYTTIEITCQSYASACATYKNVFHPNFPVWAPLDKSPSANGGQK